MSSCVYGLAAHKHEGNAREFVGERDGNELEGLGLHQLAGPEPECVGMALAMMQHRMRAPTRESAPGKAGSAGLTPSKPSFCIVRPCRRPFNSALPAVPAPPVRLRSRPLFARGEQRDGGQDHRPHRFHQLPQRPHVGDVLQRRAEYFRIDGEHCRA